MPCSFSRVFAAPAAAQTSATDRFTAHREVSRHWPRARRLPPATTRDRRSPAIPASRFARRSSMALGAQVARARSSAVDGAKRCARRSPSRVIPTSNSANRRRRRAQLVPNDTLSASRSFFAERRWAVSAISAWDRPPGSAAVVVAVVDSGAARHADLSGASCPATISSPIP